MQYNLCSCHPATRLSPFISPIPIALLTSTHKYLWQEIAKQIFFFLPLLPLCTSLSPTLFSGSGSTGIPPPDNNNDKDLCSVPGADTVPPHIATTHLDNLKPSDFFSINGVKGSDLESGDDNT